MDAARLRRRPERRAAAVDVLCVDLYDHEAASPVLDSAAFYRDCCDLLADGGVMTVNLFGRDASFETSVARIAAAFGAEQRSAAASRRKKATPSSLAMKHVTLRARDELARRAENIETRWQLPARKWLRMMRPSPGRDAASAPA